jgi:hypothetical protein
MFVQAKPLKGIAPAPKGAGISLQPTLSAVHNMEDDNGSLIASPIDGWHERIRPSFDLRWGLNSDTGVAATINPDFSQIEGDVRQLNLNQRFAFFYPERRPFFLNNIGIFTDRASTLYSRSIVDPIYGVKFSGRDGERDFGVLQALDRTPNPSVHEQATDGFTEDALQDKLAWNNILRLRQDISKQGFVGITMADKRIFDQDASPTGAFSDTINAEVSLPFAQSWVGSVYSATSYAGLDDPKLGNQTSFSLSNSPAKGLGGYINALNSTSDYRQEMGFVTRSGLQSASGGLSYGIPLEGRSFSTSGLSGNFWKEESGNQLIRGNLEQNLRLHGIHSFGVRISPTYIQFSTAENLGYEANASWDSRFSSQVRTSINASHGTTIDYDQLIPAEYSTINASGVLRLTRSTNFYSTLSYNRFVPEGQDSSYALNSYNRFMWQLSRDWGMRIVHQSTVYSYQDPLHNGSLLLTWLTTPGTEAYIGGTWNFDKDAVQNLTIFAKFTRLFRL